MRNFFYAAAGVFLLALAFHLGGTTATAQVNGQFVGIAFDSSNNYPMALTSDGRVYVKSGTTWLFAATIGGGAPVPTTQQSWGQVKERYRN